MPDERSPLKARAGSARARARATKDVALSSVLLTGPWQTIGRLPWFFSSGKSGSGDFGIFGTKARAGAEPEPPEPTPPVDENVTQAT